MKTFKTWQEYLNAQGKTIDKPVISTSGDTSPKASKFVEPFATKGLAWEDNAALKNTPMPYSAPGDDPGIERSFKLIKGKDRGQPFADDGDKKLKYEPDTEVDKTASSGGKKVDNNWPKAKTNNKTEEFIFKTKNMNTTQFTKYMTEKYRGCQCEDTPTITAHKTGAIRPDPLQAIKYVSYLANCSENVMTSLVNEINEIGCIDKLLEECLTHRESYRTLAEALDNASFERRIEHARRELQREVVGPSYGNENMPGQNPDPNAISANGQPVIPGQPDPRLGNKGGTPAGIPNGTPGGTQPNKPGQINPATGLPYPPATPGQPPLPGQQAMPPASGQPAWTQPKAKDGPGAGSGTV